MSSHTPSPREGRGSVSPIRARFFRFCPNGGCIEENQVKYSPFAAHISAGHPLLVKYLSCHSEYRVSRKITFSFPLIINVIRSKLNIIMNRLTEKGTLVFAQVRAFQKSLGAIKMAKDCCWNCKHYIVKGDNEPPLLRSAFSNVCVFSAIKDDKRNWTERASSTPPNFICRFYKERFY